MGSCSKRTLWQCIATLTGCILALAHGISLGWFSPTLPLFFSDKNPFGDPLTISEASWAGSIMPFGSLLSNLIIGYPLDYFGRKPCMYFIAIPHVLNWVLVCVGQHIACLYVARFLVGFCGGTVVVVLPVFIAEISDNNLRGTLSSCMVLTLCAGISVGLIMATYIPYYVMAGLGAALPIIYMLAIIPLPETPQSLLKRGKDEKAEKSYYFYKNLGGKSSSDPAKAAEAKAEYNTFREEVMGGSSAEKAACRDFCSKQALKAFGLIIILLIVNAFSGAFAILNYASHIFGELGSQIDPNTCANIMGVCQLLGIALAVALVDRVGRRWLLIPSLVAAGLGELAVGLLRNLASKDFLSETGWLGLILICFVEFMASIGVIALTFVIIVELLPTKILSVGTSLSAASLSIFLFIILNIYPLMIYDYGVPVIMYMSACFCIGGAVVLFFFLPETKGKKLS